MKVKTYFSTIAFLIFFPPTELRVGSYLRQRFGVLMTPSSGQNIIFNR